MAEAKPGQPGKRPGDLSAQGEWVWDGDDWIATDGPAGDAVRPLEL
jgi:hypothetical protein